VAKSGDTGIVTGPHLHFHLWSGIGSYDSHTIPIERLLLKQVGVDSDFREYDARKGELDDVVVANKYFLSNNAELPQPPKEPNILSQTPPISDPQKDKLVVITHGWHPNYGPIITPKPAGAPQWALDMKNALESKLDNSWKVEVWNWTEQAYKFRVNDAFAEGFEQGRLLGRSIADANQWQHVHLIGHSAGASVINSAALELTYWRAKGKFIGSIHLTFLDPYSPVGFEEIYAAALDFDTDWADNYYSIDRSCLGKIWETCTDIVRRYTSREFKKAHNVDVSDVDNGLDRHSFPYQWYYATITGQYPDGHPLGDDNLFEGRRYGLPRALEAGQSNWQESLGLPVGNPPIGEPPLWDKLKTQLQAAAKKTQSFIDSYVVPSATGIKNILSNGLQMITQSPTWVHTLVEMPQGTNYVRFTYQFDGTGDGYLTVYFNETLILIGDQRFDSNQPHNSGQIVVADLMGESNWLSFRLDPIGEEQASIFISNIEVGTVTNQTDLNNDLAVNFVDFAVFADRWSVEDCNENNSWCQDCDFDQSGAVDVNDVAIFTGNWLWKSPKHIKPDLNFSGAVDFIDFNFFANQWLNDCNSPDWCYGCDFDKSSVVDIFDLATFVGHWLEGTSP